MPEQRPRRRARQRRRPAEFAGVPSVHFLMICVACGLTTLGFAGHLLRPDSKVAEYMVVGGMCALFGKLSNGFGKKPHEMMARTVTLPVHASLNSVDEAEEYDQ